MIWRKIKAFLWEKFFDTGDDIVYLNMERVATGVTPEEKLVFWQEMQTWLALPQGKAYMAMMMREAQRIERLVLTEPDRAKYPELIAHYRQQNFILGMPKHIEAKIKEYRGKTTPST